MPYFEGTAQTDSRFVVRGINLNLLPDEIFLSFRESPPFSDSQKFVVVERDDTSIVFRPLQAAQFALHLWQYLFTPLSEPYSSVPYISL